MSGRSEAPAGSPAGRGPVSAPEPGEPWTVLRMIRWSAQYLGEKGIESGRLDAEHLLAAALETERLELYLQYDRPLTPPELDAYRPLLRRRAAREPLQYVLGRAAFRELELEVDERVLVPRPETEELVQAVLEWADEGGRSGLTALDVGTGSGAVALSLVREGPFRSVVATDPSPAALELARSNAEAAEVADDVAFRQGGFYDPVRDDERFDVVVSNPPYVAEGQVEELEPEIREWEPREALLAGPRGLDALEPLARGAPEVVASGGLLALELAPRQAEPVAETVRGTEAFHAPEVRRDLSGRKRILLAVRR